MIAVTVLVACEPTPQFNTDCVVHGNRILDYYRSRNPDEERFDYTHEERMAATEGGENLEYQLQYNRCRRYHYTEDGELR